jgi:hypothetical protein
MNTVHISTNIAQLQYAYEHRTDMYERAQLGTGTARHEKCQA